jgi:predicted cation transporter
MLSEQEYVDVLNNYKDKEEPKKEIIIKKKKVIVTKKEEKQNLFSSYDKSTYKKIIDKISSILTYGFGFMTYFISIMITKVILWIVKKMQNILEKEEKKTIK